MASATHSTPTLQYVLIAEETDEYPEEGHYVCAQCGEHVRVGYTADDVDRYIAGPISYYCDGRRIDKETFDRGGAGVGREASERERGYAMSATSIDPDDGSSTRFNSDVADTINALVLQYRRELERYAEEMIENDMPTSIICKDLRTYRQDIE